MGETGEDWRVAMMLPGNAPLRNLASAIYDEVLSPGQQVTPENGAFLMATLRRGPLGLVEAIAEEPGKNNLLIIDQFEEIFRHYLGGYRDESDVFVELLLATASHPRRRSTSC